MMELSAPVGRLAPAPALDPRRWWALALLCGAFFMVILDAAIVTVALPSIQEDLSFSAQGLQWVVSAYALTFAGLLLLGGRAADLLGRRRVFMVGLALFTLASLLCGLAWSDEALIGARAFQGIGAAVMTPTALSIITTLFAGSAALLGVFAIIESRHPAPLVPLRIFRSRTIVGANAVMLLFATVAFGMPFTLTLYAQQVLGYSAVKFGLTSVVFPAMAAVGSIIGQAVVLRVGFRPVAAAGMALMGAGALLLTQVSVGGSYFGDLFFGLLVFGPGIGLAFVTATVAAFAGVAEHESGIASGLSNTAFQMGAAIGTAIVATVAVSQTDSYLAANANASPLVALTEGFQSAFLAAAVLAGIGLVRALFPPAPPRRATREQLEAAAAHAAD